MTEASIGRINKGYITRDIRSGLAVYSGAAVAEFEDSQLEHYARTAAEALAKDTTKTIPEDEETLFEAMKQGWTAVVIEHTQTGDTDHLHGFAKIKPYKQEKHEKPFGSSEAVIDFSKPVYEAGSMLGSHSVNPDRDTYFPGQATAAMRAVVETAAAHAPEIPLIAITRKGNAGAKHALELAGGILVAHKPTKRLRQTPEQAQRGQPVWTDIYHMRPKK